MVTLTVVGGFLCRCHVIVTESLFPESSLYLFEGLKMNTPRKHREMLNRAGNMNIRFTVIGAGDGTQPRKLRSRASCRRRSKAGVRNSAANGERMRSGVLIASWRRFVSGVSFSCSAITSRKTRSRHGVANVDNCSARMEWNYISVCLTFDTTEYENTYSSDWLRNQLAAAIDWPTPAVNLYVPYL